MKIKECCLCGNVSYCLRYNPVHSGYTSEELKKQGMHVPICGNFKLKSRTKHGKTWKHK